MRSSPIGRRSGRSGTWAASFEKPPISREELYSHTTWKCHSQKRPNPGGPGPRRSSPGHARGEGNRAALVRRVPALTDPRLPGTMATPPRRLRRSWSTGEGRDDRRPLRANPDRPVQEKESPGGGGSVET